MPNASQLINQSFENVVLQQTGCFVWVLWCQIHWAQPGWRAGLHGWIRCENPELDGNAVPSVPNYLLPCCLGCIISCDPIPTYCT